MTLLKSVLHLLLIAAALPSATGGDVPCRVLELRPGPGNPRNSEGDFALLKDGSILYVYSHFVDGKGGDHDSAYLASRLSRDGGRTWTEKSEPVVANDAGMNVMSVSFLRKKDGALALFYARKNSLSDCRPVMRISHDEGKSWSDARECIPESEKGYYVLNNSRVCRLNSGRIVLPLCFHETKDGKFTDFFGKIVCYFSDDDGETWKRTRDCFATGDEKGLRVTTQEPGLIELKDGTVLMYVRTTHGRQWQYKSSDGCETWTRGEPGPLISPLSPASIRRLANGDLVAVWNDHETYPEMKKGPRWSNGFRVPLTIGVSRDEGRTWWPRRTLESNPKGFYCYPAILELDGYLLVGYCAENELRHSRITRVPLDWLYGKGEDVPETYDPTFARRSFFTD
ncbi:MAG: exo-alpha-sialidase [Kiritimatiellae bacterium]|nr:exo-alpha-sialidase [Kiritimatiellia bacterium]